MASALPLDEEEAVLTHDLELVVDLHAANGSAHLGHHANRKEGRLCERLQELLGLAERLVVPRRASGVVILHRPGECIRRHAHCGSEHFPGVAPDSVLRVVVLESGLHLFGIRRISDAPDGLFLHDGVGEIRQVFVREAKALLIDKDAVLVLVLRRDDPVEFLLFAVEVQADHPGIRVGSRICPDGHADAVTRVANARNGQVGIGSIVGHQLLKHRPVVREAARGEHDRLARNFIAELAVVRLDADYVALFIENEVVRRRPLHDGHLMGIKELHQVLDHEPAAGRRGTAAGCGYGGFSRRMRKVGPTVAKGTRGRILVADLVFELVGSHRKLSGHGAHKTEESPPAEERFWSLSQILTNSSVEVP